MLSNTRELMNKQGIYEQFETVTLLSMKIEKNICTVLCEPVKEPTEVIFTDYQSGLIIGQSSIDKTIFLTVFRLVEKRGKENDRDTT